MKLYSVPHSPYASRVRIQVYARGLPVEICQPPGGLGSDDFKALTPTGKVPTLDVDGLCLVESAAIMEYLEESYPHKPLMPVAAEQRAWVRSVTRFADLYLAQALFPLFLELRQRSGDQAKLDQQLGELKVQLQGLEKFLQAGHRGDHQQLDLADCALAPTLFFVVAVPPLFGEPDSLAGLPGVQNWWQWAQQQEPVAKVLAEMQVGLDAMMAGLKKAG